MNDLEKLAGILDKLKRYYEHIKKEFKEIAPSILKRRKNLDGRQTFSQVDKGSREAVKRNGGIVKDIAEVWFGPDAKAVTLPGNNSWKNSLETITGTALDPNYDSESLGEQYCSPSGVDIVELTIFNHKQERYWDGSGFNSVSSSWNVVSSY